MSVEMVMNASSLLLALRPSKASEGLGSFSPPLYFPGRQRVKLLSLPTLASSLLLKSFLTIVRVWCIHDTTYLRTGKSSK